MLRVVYSRHYDLGFFGLERLHPFDIHKYSRAWRVLRRQFGRRRLRALTVSPLRGVSRAELLAVHTAPYLDRLREPAYLARALEVPPLRRAPLWLVDWCVLRHMRRAAMGTILAAREAIRCGLAVNLAGGYHHAGPDRGEGFCVYNDIALAVDDLRRSGALAEADRLLYVDLDAHQGNGVCHAFQGDRRAFLFDVYNQSLYPAADAKARRRIDCPVPLPFGCSEADYLAALRSKLPPFVEAVVGATKAGAGEAGAGKVGLAVYNAGTDVYQDDVLGGLRVSADGVLERDRFVIDLLVGRGIPTVMLPSGGYSPESYRLLANTVAWMLEEYGG